MARTTRSHEGTPTMRMTTRLMRMLLRRDADAPSPVTPPGPRTVRRDVHVPADFHAMIGDVAADRIRQASRRGRDPLGLEIDAEWAEDGDMARLTHLARAVLAGTLTVPRDQPRADLLPLTGAMLRLAGIDADGFSALAALNVPAGLYVDGPDGRTMVKAVDPHFDQRGPASDVTVRIRVPSTRPGGPMTYWQEPGRPSRLGVPRLPATVVATLVEGPLSRLVDLPGGGEGVWLLEAEDTDEFDPGPMTVFTLGDRRGDGQDDDDDAS